ncbi:MAG: hypothetical protein KJZ47_11540 [Gemmatimonadales bacterium]|nr:hypothetical protein [Gemmatimonadales bacterium]
MMDCERLSDRMPDVARGRAAWTRDDAAHLAECSSCQQEWELVRAAATHGIALSQQVDVTRLIEGVTARLEVAPPAASPRRVPWRRLAWPLAIAASLSLMIWGGMPRNVPTEANAPALAAVLHELDDLTPAELEAMLELVPEAPAVAFRTLETPESLGDLSAEELELLLSSMED